HGTDFQWINKILKRSDLDKLIERIYYQFGKEATVTCLDRVKRLGFYYATVSGMSLSIEDLVFPSKKDDIIADAEHEVEKIETLYMDGVITNGERKNKVISIWGRATASIAQS